MLLALTIYGALAFTLGTICGALGVMWFVELATSKPARHV